ncbi:MAG TPA: EF-hand domain-containing protein [Isosphaeraceae bacterium]|nr:EF-hand domain-containing protein [Isosphaeraceae bacterium]
MTGASAFLVLILALAAPPAQEPAPGGTGSDAARHLIFLAEDRPLLVRLRVMCQDRPFEASWIDSVRTLHASLDRNGDGTITTKEAGDKSFPAIVRLATGAAVPPARAELDVHPKDGVISVDELAEALRPILGPFQLQFRRLAVGRTDALFDQLDRDKDGVLTRPELAAIAGSLRPLDLDDNEMISAEELEPFNSPAFTAMMEESSDRRARFATLPPVVELVVGESSLRPARLLLKKYDKGKGDVPGRPDNKLSPSEFAIDPDAFARADTNGDDALDTEELRKFLARAPIDLTLDVALSPQASGRATIRAGAGGVLPKGARVRQLADGDVEFAIGQVRLDIQVEQASTVAEDVRRVLTQRFKAADANKDGYLDGKERAALDAPRSPLAGLSEVIDRDGDGKIYLNELLEFGQRQVEAARGRLVVTTADQGRAIFGILDLDRDRRLGAREVMRTVDRVMSWDSDGDGRVSPDEIPYHFLVSIARGGVPGLTGEGPATAAPRAMAATRPTSPGVGPDWFQKMDRNHDGDVSRREFLGPRDQFNRLDRDNDGLIDRDEARAAVPAKRRDAPRDGGRP